MKCKVGLLYGAALMPLAIAPSIANAQVTGSSESGNVGNTSSQTAPLASSDEIVVTALRGRDSLRNVPMSVDVVTGSELKKLKIFDTKDIQSLSPGLQLTNTFGRNNVATLRGISFDPDSGAPPAVDIYYNEVPADAQTVFTALYDVDQIEVLRGPQGSLRGRTSPAGSITIATRKPDMNAVDGYAQLTGSDRDAYNFQGAVSIPIVQDKFAIRTAMLMDGNRINDLYNVTRGDHSRSRTESGRLSVAWTPTSDFRFDASYQYLNADNRQYLQVVGPGAQPSLLDPARSGPPATIRDEIAVSDGNARYRNRTHFLTASAAWDLGSQTLSFVGGYQDTILRQQSDADTANAIPGFYKAALTTSTYLVKTAEVRLDSHRTGFWNYTLDAFFSRQTGQSTVAQDSSQFFVGPGNLLLPYSLGYYLPLTAFVDVPVNSRTASVAGSSSFHFTSKLKLDVAARYSWYRNIVSSLLSVASPGAPVINVGAFSSPPTETILPENRKLNPRALTGSANLSYQLSSNATAYVAYGRSFRPGTAAVAITAPLDNSLLITKNEKSDSVEVGLKTSLLDRRLSFNIDAFYQKFHNYIGRTPNAVAYSSLRDGVVDGGAQFNFNGNAEIKGIEAQLSGHVNANIDLSIGAAYDHARYKNAMEPCNDSNGDGIPDGGAAAVPAGEQISMCRTNSRIADVPDFTLTSNGEYHLTTGQVEPFIRYLFNYVPSVRPLGATFKYPDRELLNLYAGVRGPKDRWEATIFVKNLLDQRRVTNSTLGVATVATTTPGVNYNSGYYIVNSTPPREIGGTLLFNF